MSQPQKKKTCTKCHQDKDVENFNKRITNADGLDSWCCGCRKEYMTARENKKKEFNEQFGIV